MLMTNQLRVLALLTGTAAYALGQGHDSGQFKGDLSGLNEVPSVLTIGSGQLTVVVSDDHKSLDATLDFTALVGVAQSAGLYLGFPATTGGKIALLCGGAKPACPTTADGSVKVTITSADVLAIAAQGLAAGDLASVIQAMGDGAVYVNVNTDKFINGEIRGQLGRGSSSDGSGDGNGNANGNGNRHGHNK